MGLHAIDNYSNPVCFIKLFGDFATTMVQLYERVETLTTIKSIFHNLEKEGGHTVCITGEAGIGKTSLTQYFINHIREKAHVFEGYCDFLFTPRPLGPLYDFAKDFHPDLSRWLDQDFDRSRIFSRIFEVLQKTTVPVVMIFEDIHWADEATLDLIKFLGRRIHKIRCLFVLTFRDDEVLYGTSLKQVLGEIPKQYYTKIRLQRLSKETVRELARSSHVSGEEVFRVSSGNPFFVKEILANYNVGIPENIKDLVLSVFQRQPQRVRERWEVISIFPSGMKIWLFNIMYPDGLNDIEETLQSGILICESGLLHFKHELYRATLEDALSTLKKMNLHKVVLAHLLDHPDKKVALVQIVHHAKHAHDWKIVEEYAPRAALQAVSLGAHVEASRLYATAIEYCNRYGVELATLYESYAYECYLTNQIREAIVGQEKALAIWREAGDKIREGSSLRFISRLSWFEGKRDQAEATALESIEVLEALPVSKELVIAYSNYGQLKMLGDDVEGTKEWTDKTLALAEKFCLDDIKSHALNNLGTIQALQPPTFAEGFQNLEQSLGIALNSGFQEHAARAYTNIISVAMITRNYQRAEKYMEEGLQYCYDHDLDSWTYYKSMMKVRLLAELGKWKEAEEIAFMLVRNTTHPGIVTTGSHATLGILMARKGYPEEAWLHIEKAKDMALQMKESQRSVPVACALLEYGWIYNRGVDTSFIDQTFQLLENNNNVWHYSELLYWMDITGHPLPPYQKIQEPFSFQISRDWKKAAAGWNAKGCPYQFALALAQGEIHDKKEAFRILEDLGAGPVIERLKLQLRNSGASNIPRGSRKSTRENPALLTTRQVEVLSLLQKGLQNHEIAEQLFVSSKTVDNHLASIFSKLNVNSRTKAIVEATRLGIL